MTTTDIEVRKPGPLAIPHGARPLGQYVKPIIRLGMGVQDAARKGAPRATDYFTVRGDERAVAKFRSVYGAEPKAVKVMLPAELPRALEISYRSFVGGGSEEGGRPLAMGVTNFAPLGYAGGPDLLRVWAQDGEYLELETLGLDELGKPLDEIAERYAIELHTTLTFTIPEVLGWGSFCAVTSKGRKSAGNLVYKCEQIYGAFGSKTPWAFDPADPPLLVLKPDSAIRKAQDKEGKPVWAKTKIYALDLVIPESLNAMLDRLARRQAEIDGAGGARALVYGPGNGEPRALPAATESEVIEGSPAATLPPAGEVAQEGTAAGVETPPSEPEATPAPAAAAEPKGEWQIARSFTEDGYRLVDPDGVVVGTYKTEAAAIKEQKRLVAEEPAEGEQSQFKAPELRGQA